MNSGFVNRGERAAEQATMRKIAAGLTNALDGVVESPRTGASAS
jgi:hypothetical protein